MSQPERTRLRLPHWTAHPGFGVAALLAVAVLLIIHGEPQPSSRPSGKSVTVSGSASPPAQSRPILVIHEDRLELRRQGRVTTIVLPDHARPVSVMTHRNLSIALGEVAGRQRAYAIAPNLHINDLGFADAVVPAVEGTAAFIVETATVDPGQLPVPQQPYVSGSPSTQTSLTTNTNTNTPKDYLIRRFDSEARVASNYQALPPGTRIGTDTAVGLVVWKPLNLVFDGPVALEPLSAYATLIRPDGSERALGPVYPLASSGHDLLVWDVQRRQFGLMPLRYATSTATSTASPTASGSSGSPGPIAPSATGVGASGQSRPGRGAGSAASATPSATPTTVPGVRWFGQSRGFIVTGPAGFAPDDSAFAVYAQVGSRRRLVVAQVGATLTDQIEVLALSVPIQPTPSVSESAAPSGSSATATASPTPSPTAPIFTPDGFPIPAPLYPLWWSKRAIGVGTDGAVVSYQPGGTEASLLDLGVSGIESLADAP
jgi:hypothetical protein